jgi:hypothetical protein
MVNSGRSALFVSDFVETEGRRSGAQRRVDRRGRSRQGQDQRMPQQPAPWRQIDKSALT